MKRKIAAMAAIICLLVSLAGTAVLAANTASDAVTVNGNTMTITSDYSTGDIPAGFYETKLSYNSNDYYGGKDEATGTMQLFYLVNDSDTSLNGFYLLGSDGVFRKFNSVTIKERQLIILTPEESIAVPKGYSQTSAAIGNEVMTVWQSDTATTQGEYLVYGTLDGTTMAWYIYNQKSGTVGKYDSTLSDTITQNETTITDLQTQLKDLNTKYNTDIGKSKNIYLIAILVSILFLFLMLNAMMKRRHTTLDLEERIIDLKRHGGTETQNFSKYEERRNAKQDAKAERRLNNYNDDGLTVGETYNAESARASARAAERRRALAAANEPLQPESDDMAGSKDRTPEKTESFLIDDDLFFDDDEISWDTSTAAGAAAAKLSRTSPQNAPNIPAPSFNTASGNHAQREPHPAVQTAVEDTKRITPDKRVVTMAAAGDRDDFDLDLLEKNLAKMTDKVMSEEAEAAARPREPVIPKTPAKATSSDIAKAVASDKDDDDFTIDIINLDD